MGRGTCRYVKGFSLDDLADVAVTSPIEDDILVYNDATNKFENKSIHDFIGGLNFAFYLSDTADGVIGGYLRMYDANTGEAESSVNASITGTGIAVEEWITASDQPTFTILSPGVYNVHLHADKSGPGTKECRLYWELYKRATGGAETLLITSEETDPLTTAKAAYVVHGILSTEQTLASDDRLVLKILGNATGAGTDPTATVYMEGTTATRIEVLTVLEALDERYLRLDGAAPMEADLDMDENNIDNIGVLFLKEQAAADGDVAGSGQIWVKSGTPNTLWFTDDGGTDYQLALGFVDRGDPAAADFRLGDVTTDYTWRDMDLSGIVSVGAKCVLMRVSVKDNVADSLFQFRTDGNSNGLNSGIVRTYVANVWSDLDVKIALPASRIIEYRATNTTFSDLYITVSGWWF